MFRIRNVMLGMLCAALVMTAVDAQITVRRGSPEPGNTRIYTNRQLPVANANPNTFSQQELNWINQNDQLLLQYQQQNPYTVGSPEWIQYNDQLMTWYQGQNPFTYGTPKWTSFNDRLIDWYAGLNPYPAGTEAWRQYASRTNEFNMDVLGSPRRMNYDAYMQQVYQANPYTRGTAEWNEYNNYYANLFQQQQGTTGTITQPQTPTQPQTQGTTQIPGAMQPTPAPVWPGHGVGFRRLDQSALPNAGTGAVPQTVNPPGMTVTPPGPSTSQGMMPPAGGTVTPGGTGGAVGRR